MRHRIESLDQLTGRTDPTDQADLTDLIDQADTVTYADRRERVRAKQPRKRPRRERAATDRRGRITEEERERAQRQRADVAADFALPPEADRWSTWDDGERGPEPHPPWLVTELAAYDVGLGVLKTGKEADVHLLERRLPGSERGCLLASKRYRGSDHRLFHRDAGYLEGRRVRKSRETRAMATRSAFGRNLIAEQWAVAEFGALGQLWAAGLPVPYPVQRIGTELLLEFVGSPDGVAAPRLAELRPSPDQLLGLWHQLTSVLHALAGNGLAHGDLSPYNLLVDGDRLVLIDLPQVVDVVANPAGPQFLARDVRTCCAWFRQRGLPAEVVDADATLAAVEAQAGLTP